MHDAYNYTVMSISEDPAFSEVIEDDKVIVDKDGYNRVDVRDVREFEDDLLTEITGPDKEGRGASIPVKGKWIHGWLESRGEDWINSIHKNWLFFTVYVSQRTKQFMNISQFSLKQGDYDDTYRYLMILEDLDLIERHRIEEVDSAEYDHFVPETMRQRTYVRIVKSFNEEPSLWTRPHKNAYPGGEAREPTGMEERERDIDDIERQIKELSEQESDDTETEVEDIDVAREGVDIPDGVMNNLSQDENNLYIEDYPQYNQIVDRVNDWFGGAVDKTFEDTTVELEGIEAAHFMLDRIAVFGVWAEGNAMMGDKLELYVTIDGNQATMQPPFVIDGIKENLSLFLQRDSRIDKNWFNEIVVVTAYSQVFKSRLEDIVSNVQELELYYDLQEEEYVKL